MVQRVNIRELREVCTYWATQPSDFEDGGYTFEAPLLLKCRWENKVQLVVDDQERKFQSMIQVWVDRPVQTEGFLARGDHTKVADPTAFLNTTLPIAFRVRSTSRCTDLRNLRIEHKAYC